MTAPRGELPPPAVDLSQPDRLREIAPLAVGFLLLIAIVAATAGLATMQRKNAGDLRRSFDIRNEIGALFSDLQDAETGQRGYLLTGNEEYLRPYETAAAEIARRGALIAGAVEATPGLAAGIAEIRQVAAEKLSELRETVALRRAGQADAALALVRMDRGKDLMDRLRGLVEGFRAENDRILFERQDEASSAARWLQVAIVAAVLLVVALAVFVVVDARRRNRRIEQARTSLEEANRSLVSGAASRDRLEHELRQSQKMEALGQLTGGLAHDFNNMLAIIIGNLNLLKRRLDRGETRIERHIDQALQGAERAATLTHRLLAFARKQPLLPEPLACNRLIPGMSELLSRSLGETVRVETVLAGGLWQTEADGHQLESAILNLAVNARDAMPEGGRLTIETANAHLDDVYAAQNADVPAGQYVMIAVSDSGEGMTPAVMARAFDPFFTTKAVGKGTGLGLSQVYGFVKQSGGHVKIYSEPGRGTTVKIYLPRFIGVAAAETNAAPASRVIPQGDPRQIILVVEDEDGVRGLVVEALRELNYTVIHAEGAAGALRLLDAHPDVALLFTDVVMPETSGKQLADAARLRRPGLPVLYTTGYTRNAIVHNGVVDADVLLLSKPYTLEQLALKVRQAIARETVHA
jgi:signal transduction histidine kinase/CheY-like chemotaxis protein